VKMKSVEEIFVDKNVLELYQKYEKQIGYPPKDAKTLFTFGQEFHKDMGIRFDEIKVEMDRIEKEKEEHNQKLKQMEEAKTNENNKPMEAYNLSELVKEFRAESKNSKIVEDEKFLQKLHSFITLEKRLQCQIC